LRVLLVGHMHDIEFLVEMGFVKKP
jgi:hypothetical protein